MPASLSQMTQVIKGARPYIHQIIEHYQPDQPRNIQIELDTGPSARTIAEHFGETTDSLELRIEAIDYVVWRGEESEENQEGQAEKEQEYRANWHLQTNAAGGQTAELAIDTTTDGLQIQGIPLLGDQWYGGIQVQLAINLNGETIRYNCLLYTSPSPRDLSTSRMPSSA